MKISRVINKKNTISAKNNIKLPLIKLNNSRRKSIEIHTSNDIKNIKEIIPEMNENKFNESIIEEEKEKENKNNRKINDIINNVNKNHNIFSKIVTDRNKNDIIDNNSSINIKDKTINECNNVSSIENNDNKQKKYFNKKYHYYHNIFSNKKNYNSMIETPKKTLLIPRITKEKLKQLKEKRQKRLIQEKKRK